jgi:hypothetical protein
MKTELPGPVPEIPVTDIDAVVATYQDSLGFTRRQAASPYRSMNPQIKRESAA